YHDGVWRWSRRRGRGAVASMYRGWQGEASARRQVRHEPAEIGVGARLVVARFLVSTANEHEALDHEVGTREPIAALLTDLDIAIEGRAVLGVTADVSEYAPALLGGPLDRFQTPGAGPDGQRVLQRTCRHRERVIDPGELAVEDEIGLRQGDVQQLDALD